MGRRIRQRVCRVGKCRNRESMWSMKGKGSKDNPGGSGDWKEKMGARRRVWRFRKSLRRSVHRRKRSNALVTPPALNNKKLKLCVPLSYQVNVSSKKSK